MKKTFICLLLLATALVYADQKTFMVMSDMHVMVDELWNKSHPEVFYSDPKMVEHSQELFDLAIQRVKDNAPDFLLVPGDLTYNGELKNHQYVAQKFAELEAAGIQVFVIPGNHDISDPGAKDYSSGTPVKTDNLSAIGFAELYADFGYNEAVMRLDEGVDSLAYMTYLFDDIAIIGLNTNLSNIGGHKSAGGFTEGMMTFLKKCTKKALLAGRNNILVMAHHPVMEHINGQSFIDKNHIANMADDMIPLSDIQQQLLASHVHVVFTGHAHIHSAAHISSDEYGTLYDISTGSTCSYPSPLRKGTIDTDNGLLSLTGDEITTYQEEGYLRDTVLANTAINTLATTLYTRIGEIKAVVNKFPMLKLYLNMDKLNKYDANGIRKVTHQYLDEQLRKAFCALSRGDEDVFYSGNEVQDGLDAFDNLLMEVIGVNYATLVMVANMAGMDTDFGVNPEMLFRSIYENIVVINEEEIYTPDASGNSGEEGALLDNISLRDLKPFELSRDIVLQENEAADYYDNFNEDYNGLTVNTVTLNRTFAQGKWATLCLPFNVNKGLMMALGFYGRVFEFRYADIQGSDITVYFAIARSIEAGKGYIVNANEKLAAKNTFVFPNVTIITDADNGDITTLTGNNDGSGRGNLYLAGTLRTGLLQTSTGGSTYLGLKDNKIYSPNAANGTTIRAYRGFFRSDAPMNAQRVRIIADGEEVGQWILDREEDAMDNAQAVKYIDNGIMVIERNGITYTVQGQRID